MFFSKTCRLCEQIFVNVMIFLQMNIFHRKPNACLTTKRLPVAIFVAAFIIVAIFYPLLDFSCKSDVECVLSAHGTNRNCKTVG